MVVFLPDPRTDDRYTTVIVVAGQIFSRISANRIVCHKGQWLFFTLQKRSVTLKQIAAWITNINSQNRNTCFRHKSQFHEVFPETTFADHFTFIVERITLTGIAHPSTLEDFGKFAFRVYAPRKYGDGVSS